MALQSLHDRHKIAAREVSVHTLKMSVSLRNPHVKSMQLLD